MRRASIRGSRLAIRLFQWLFWRLRAVVLDGLRPTLLGVGIGTAAAISLSHLLATLICGVQATDVSTYVAVATLLTAVGVLASIIPAYRATLIDPVGTLRGE